MAEQLTHAPVHRDSLQRASWNDAVRYAGYHEQARMKERQLTPDEAHLLGQRMRGMTQNLLDPHQMAGAARRIDALKPLIEKVHSGEFQDYFTQGLSGKPLEGKEPN